MLLHLFKVVISVASNNLANLKSTDKVDIKLKRLSMAQLNDVDLDSKALRDKTGGKITATVQGSIANSTEPRIKY